jgi:hypothetical protein
MHIEGTFIVNLAHYHYSGMGEGSWNVTRDDKSVLSSHVLVNEPWEHRIVPHGTIREGDILNAESFTGKTGVTGTVIGSCEDSVLVEGTAWCGLMGIERIHEASDSLMIRTAGFSVGFVEATYTGSIDAFYGRRLDWRLLTAICRYIERERNIPVHLLQGVDY